MKTFHRNLLPALLMAAALLAGCSSSGNYYLSPDYQENKVNEEVLILPVKQEIFARYFQHTFGFLSSTQEEIFWDALERGYSRSAGVTARTYNYDSIDSADFKITSLDIRDGTMEVITPSGTRQFQVEGVSPGFVLLLDQFSFEKTAENAGSSGYAGHEREIDYSLRFETKYVYWDTRNNAPVAWGIATSDKDLDGEEATEDDYNDLLAQVLERIAENGPVRGNPQP